MKIRLLTDAAEWGGTEVHVLQLGRTLVARGHDVAIVELGRHAYEQTGRARAAGVKVLHVAEDADPTKSSAGHGRRWRAWSGLVREVSADVCVLAKGFIDVGSWQFDVAARLCAPRYVTIEHLTCPMPPKAKGRHFGGMVPGLGLWWYRTLARRATRAIWPHRVICVSEAVREQLADRYGFPASKLVTVCNGIDVSAFARDEAARRTWRKAWGADDDTLVFGAVGRLSGMKGYDAAVELFAQLCRENVNRDLRLVLAGDGPSRASLEEAARAAGIGERVLFPGHTDRAKEIYSALDVFVMPSLTEGLPLALLEAMACECCPIAMGVGGIPEVLTDPSVGWLVPAQDRSAFLDAMRTVAHMPRATLAAMGTRARARVAAQFDARTQFAAVAEIIEEAGRS